MLSFSPNKSLEMWKLGYLSSSSKIIATWTWKVVKNKQLTFSMFTLSHFLSYRHAISPGCCCKIHSSEQPNQYLQKFVLQTRKLSLLKKPLGYLAKLKRKSCFQEARSSRLADLLYLYSRWLVWLLLHFGARTACWGSTPAAYHFRDRYMIVDTHARTRPR